MQQDSSRSDGIDHMGNLVIGLTFGVIRSFAVGVEVFLRRDFGARYLGTNCGGVFLLILIFIAGSEGYPTWPLFAYLILFTYYLFKHLIQASFRERRGIHHIHQFYHGFPRLARWFPRLSEQSVKVYIEFPLMVSVASAIIPFAPLLGLYLFGGAFCSLAQLAEWNGRMNRRARQLHDSVMEQEEVARRFREMRR
ncbi:MAG: hypothetical protein KDA65_18525 [Planctomycetaceae bacterium]|nr:hypothetical protein [Planctomycetaceae bacterium]